MKAWLAETMSGIDDDAARPPPRLRRAVGGFLALAAVTGFGVLLVNTYSGHAGGAARAIPLIRADLSPVRIRPEQPGGMTVPHQDRLVLQQGGIPAEDVQLVPPPEDPIPEPSLEAMIEPPPPETMEDLIQATVFADSGPAGGEADGGPELLIPRDGARALAARHDGSDGPAADGGPDPLEMLINRALQEDVQAGLESRDRLVQVAAARDPDTVPDE